MTPVATARRIGAGARKPANWAQLLQFGLVGASGYLINLAVFAVLVELADLHHALGAVGAFCVAVSSNFYWNRHWTFRASDGNAGFQAARFFTVSLGGLLVNLAILEGLIGAGLDALPAQAIAVATVMPLNFVGNKLWTFQ
jgi:dolichol-phosphate mannosyltransferase